MRQFEEIFKTGTSSPVDGERDVLILDASIRQDLTYSWQFFDAGRRQVIALRQPVVGIFVVIRATMAFNK